VQHVERASAVDLCRQSTQEMGLDLVAMVLAQPLPGLWLGRIQEVDDHLAVEAQRPVVVRAGPFPVLARRER